MTKILLCLRLFASAILLKSGAALLPKTFVDAFGVQLAKEIGKTFHSEMTPTSPESTSGSIPKEGIDAPKMIQFPNIGFFVTRPDMMFDEAQIRSQIFAFDELPVIPGKFMYFKRGYWVDC